MEVLVTGGAGFIGSHIADRLLSEGNSVSILDSLDVQVHPHSIPDYIPKAAKFYKTDVRNKDELNSLLEDVDVVVHCAAAVGVAQSLYRVRHYLDVNVVGTATLLEVLIERKHPLHRLIVLTSMTGYGEGLYRRLSDGHLVRPGIRTEEGVQKWGWEPVCPETKEKLEPVPTPEDADLMAKNVYALSKRYQAELSLHLGDFYDFPVVCFRLFNVYGPRQSLSNPYTGVLAIFLSRILSGQSPIIYEDGGQTRDFVSVHDIVNAVMLSLKSDAANGTIMNLGSGIPRSIKEVARTLAHMLKEQDIEPQVTDQFRKGDVRHCYADISRANKLLGYKPAVEWEDGLSELIEWARQAPTTDQFDKAEKELREHGLLSKRSSKSN